MKVEKTRTRSSSDSLQPCVAERAGSSEARELADNTMAALPGKEVRTALPKFVAQDGPAKVYYGQPLPSHWVLPAKDSHGDGLGRHLDLLPHFNDASSVPVGHRYKWHATDREEIRSLRALGFTQEKADTYRRSVDLTTPCSMKYFTSTALPNVDAVAMVTVFRSGLQEQYVYKALSSTLAELPANAIINLFLGNGDSDYVSPSTLAAKLGREKAAKINLVPAPDHIVEFFKINELGRRANASWNFARVLLSYAGTQSVMVLEDDLEFSRHALLNLAPWLANQPTPLLMLFNSEPHEQDNLWRQQASQLRLQMLPVRRNWDFTILLATIFSRSITKELGLYVAYRGDRESHDYLVGRFVSGTIGGVGRFFPSVVQHRGVETTGVTGMYEPLVSPCWQTDLGLPNTERQPGGM